MSRKITIIAVLLLIAGVMIWHQGLEREPAPEIPTEPAVAQVPTGDASVYMPDPVVIEIKQLPPKEIPQDVGSKITASNIFILVNNERIGANLPSLKRSAELDAVAQAKLDDMIEGKYFAHTSPEGKDPWYWFNQASFPYEYAGENLARKYDTAQETVEGWMNSPTHRANILKPVYVETGIAVHGDVVVQVFANRK